MVKKLILSIIMWVVVIAGLSSCHTTLPQPTRQLGEDVTIETNASVTGTLPYPTPTLTPAVEFTDGVSDVPEGFRIFLEYKHASEPTGEDCPSVVIQAGVPASYVTFYFDGERIHALSPCWKTGECYPRAVLIADCYHSISADVAEGEYWCDYRTIDSLPAVIGDVGIVLRAIDKEGTVVVEIKGQPYYVYPGGHWEQTIITKENFFGETCDHTQTTSLTNYGLIGNDEIVIEIK